MKSKFIDHVFRSLFISVVLALLIQASYLGGLFFGIESFFEDILVGNKAVSEKIIILGIDNESIAKMGQWPWPRETYGKLFSELEKFGPASVGFDVVLSESSRTGWQDDEKLAQALSKITFPVVMATEAMALVINNDSIPTSESFLLPISAISSKNTVSLGHVNLIADRDGVVRNIPLRIKGGDGDIYGAMSTEVLLKSGMMSTNSLVGRKEVERIVFSGGSGSVREIPIWRVINGSYDAEGLRDKIIFIGATATDLHDAKQTPMDKGTEMSGVEIQAQITNMFLGEYRLNPLAPIYLFLWFLTATFMPFLFFYFTSGILRALSMSLGAGILYILGIIYLFDIGIIANFVHINLAWILGTLVAFLYKYLSLDKEKRTIRDTFSKYLSSDVLEELLKNPSLVKLGGEEREVTIFFSDVRGFTTLSEGMTPEQLTRFLNRYLTKMTDIILKERGVVDKYIGDAIMAFWGAPLPNDTQAEDAVLASLEMIKALNELNSENVKNGDPEIDIGIGLNFGKVTLGNMGSEARFDYTIMGDAVNLASRLESQTKNYGVKIIISEAVKNEIGDERVKELGMVVREIDKIIVKGKNKPVTIFEVILEDKKDVFGKISSDFERMRDLYYAGKWHEAISVAELIEKEMSDGPTKVIKDRCQSFMVNPPINWSGVYEMKGK